jgi:hypothetical protein
MIFSISQLFYRLRETVFNITQTYDFQYQSVVFLGYVRLYLTLHRPMILVSVTLNTVSRNLKKQLTDAENHRSV